MPRYIVDVKSARSRPDRRYVGPRSAFGGALRAAQAKARELNNGEGR